MGVARKQFVMRVDEEILRRFDGAAWERKQTRTSLVVELMEQLLEWDADLEKSGGPQSIEEYVAVVEHEVAESKKQAVVRELRAGLAAVKANCEHPKAERQKFSWGSKCGVCGAIVR